MRTSEAPPPPPPALRPRPATVEPTDTGNGWMAGACYAGRGAADVDVEGIAGRRPSGPRSPEHRDRQSHHQPPRRRERRWPRRGWCSPRQAPRRCPLRRSGRRCTWWCPRWSNNSPRRVGGACAVGEQERRHRCHERDQRGQRQAGANAAPPTECHFHQGIHYFPLPLVRAGTRCLGRRATETPHPRRSATRLPALSSQALRLCAPASRRVCLSRGTGVRAVRGL